MKAFSATYNPQAMSSRKFPYFCGECQLAATTAANNTKTNANNSNNNNNNNNKQAIPAENAARLRSQIEHQ